MAFYRGESGALTASFDPKSDKDQRKTIAGLEQGNLFLLLENKNNTAHTTQFLSENNIHEPGDLENKITDPKEFKLKHVYHIQKSVTSDDRSAKIKGIGTIMNSSTATRTKNVRNWTFTLNREAYETTPIGQNFRTYTGGMLIGEGTIDIISSDDKEHLTTSAFQNMITNMTSSDTEGDFLLILAIDGKDGSGGKPGYTADSYFAFRAYITSADVSSTVGEISGVTFNFTTNGPVAMSFPSGK